MLRVYMGCVIYSVLGYFVLESLEAIDANVLSVGIVFTSTVILLLLAARESIDNLQWIT